MRGFLSNFYFTYQTPLVKRKNKKDYVCALTNISLQGGITNMKLPLEYHLRNQIMHILLLINTRYYFQASQYSPCKPLQVFDIVV